MSFITDIIRYGLGQFGVEATGDTPQALAQSAITNFVSEKVNSHFKLSNPTTSSTGVTQALPPDAQSTIQETERTAKQEFKADVGAHIPVVYGESWMSPQVVDAYLTNDFCTMWYAVVLSEYTGTVQSTGQASQVEFLEILIDNKRAVFQSDGVTLDYLADQNAAITNVRGSVKIYPYVGNSESPVEHGRQFDAAQHGNAYDIFPTWDSNKQMNNLVFALIRVDYNASDEVPGIGSIKFKLKNSMHWPGDVLYDYMTNSIYGCGIPTEEVDL
jgi:hypothetical protein